MPTKGAHPHDPAVGKNGDLWFTEQMANKIGRFDPTSQTFKEYPIKGENAGPTDWFPMTMGISGSPRIWRIHRQAGPAKRPSHAIQNAGRESG